VLLTAVKDGAAPVFGVQALLAAVTLAFRADSPADLPDEPISRTHRRAR
jgi:hypothetical protein